MKHFTNIADYCRAINVSAPKQPNFDIRTFEENMPSVVANMEPFKHEFYAIAIKVNGSGKAITSHYSSFPDGATVFFNTPFQLISWDILPDWQGYYIMFAKEFIAQSKHLQNLLSDFPFLKIDKSVPFAVEPQEVSTLLSIYDVKYQEQHRLRSDSNQIIEAHTLALLTYIKRFFTAHFTKEEASNAIRKADVNLLSRFQTLLEITLNNSETNPGKVHSPSFYADQIAVHPNHLNAIVKQITGHTAKAHINGQLIRMAKSHLVQTSLSVKEIAYALHFDSPNNFNAFFKKHTGQTPNSYRKTQ